MSDITLEIAPAKVVHVIYQAREGGLADAELREFIAGLNDDEKAHLTAIAWVGRGAAHMEPALAGRLWCQLSSEGVAEPSSTLAPSSRPR